MSSQNPALSNQLRSIYRSILRELPARPLSSPSPLQRSLRDRVAQRPSDSSSGHADPSSPKTQRALRQAEQYLHYVRAQRMYATLLERYNPGMDMDEEERVRLSARRVGMNLPSQFGGKGGSESN
ncbi:MAG: SCF ubiquitin ligase complex subunit cdc4 [Chaenotheca gracillima]|nr:MAG: SCF ubiquitin ligase complex subunit cdc4 [Chaenotheca gracillima]